MRVAAYYRVSKDDQDADAQAHEVRSYMARRTWNAAEFRDEGWSGAKDARPELDRLMKELRQRRFDVVVVWKFDRFARSLRHLVQALEELRQLGVEFISVTEAVDTSTPAGRAMFGMIAVFAEFEREVLRERVRAGLAKARAQGKRLGRAAKVLDLEQARRRLGAGESLRSVASSLAVAHTTLARALARPPA